MGITLRVSGRQYENFAAAQVTVQLDALSRSFSFEATSDEALPLPFRGGEACEVHVDGERVLTGFIELVNVSGSPGEHKIDVQGRDRTGDLVDSSLAAAPDLSAPISLATICRRVIAHLGQDIEVVDTVRPAAFRAEEDLAAPAVGQNAYEFLEKLARKRQVLLTADPDGRLTIVRGSGVDAPGARIQNLVARPGSDRALANTVLSYSVSYDTTGRFNRYLQVSQMNGLNVADTAASLDPAAVASQGDIRVARDQAVRRGRQHVLVSESMFSSPEAASRAEWERDVRRARGKVYSATVDGYRDQDGNLWATNRLVSVLDEYAGIDVKMLVNSVTFSFDLDGGRSTALGLVERDAYLVALQEPEDADDGMGEGLT